MSLRPYQLEALKAMQDSIKHGLNPVADIPTGGGKSHVLMGLAEWAVSFKGKRCLILAHRKELLEQNSKKTNHDVAFYSAGLGIKDLTSSPIIIAGIQSIYKLSEEALPTINLLIVDECHRVPHEDDSMFQTLIAKLLLKNPKMRIAGFTATPYNLAPVFNHIAYSIGIGDLIEQGFLCPLKSRISSIVPNLDPVPIVLGDYVVSKLGEAMMDKSLVAETVSNIMWYGQNHYSWLVFCVNVKHTEVIYEAIREQGIFVEMLTGETPSEERADILKRFKERTIQCLVNCEVLTTGFDAPNVDMLVMLRPTQSRTLYVQMVGRACRLYPDKPYALVLDHADNINTHGTITNLLPIGKRVSKGEANTYTHRRCPQCESACEIKATSCEECGYEFPIPKRIIDHDGKPADLDIMGDGGKWHTVHYVAYNAHIKKGTKEGEFPLTMRVTYICGTEEFSEWVCVEHPERGIARRRAVKWLQERNKESLPSTVQEALELKYKEPTRIRVIPDGDYKRISAYEF